MRTAAARPPKAAKPAPRPVPDTQTFQLDWIPVAKSRPRVTRWGTYTPEKTVTAEGSLAFELLARGAKCYPAGVPLGVTLGIRLVRPKSNKRSRPTVKPDLDQYIKLVLDACIGILWYDDCQVCHVGASKAYVDKPGLGLQVFVLGEF